MQVQSGLGLGLGLEGSGLGLGLGLDVSGLGLGLEVSGLDLNFQALALALRVLALALALRALALALLTSLLADWVNLFVDYYDMNIEDLTFVLLAIDIPEGAGKRVNSIITVDSKRSIIKAYVLHRISNVKVTDYGNSFEDVKLFEEYLDIQIQIYNLESRQIYKDQK